MRHVALSRSESKPLGFTIAGGKGSRKGDIGIFIGHIHDNGAASQEGSMKVRLNYTNYKLQSKSDYFVLSDIFVLSQCKNCLIVIENYRIYLSYRIILSFL